MAIEYDEIRITTRREIQVCNAAIKKLEKVLGDMERRYDMTSHDFLEQFAVGATTDNREFILWHESCLALERWRERLSDHWRIMNG